MAFEFRAGIVDLDAKTVLGNFIDDEGCGHCQKAFNSGDLRLSAGILIDMNERFEIWFHFDCFFLVHSPASIDDIKGSEKLTSREQQRIRTKIMQLLDNNPSSKKAKVPKSSAPSTSAQAKKNRQKQINLDPQHDEALIKSQNASYQTIRQLLEAFSDDKVLYEFLRLNNSRVPWSYEKLLDRCADFVAFGAIEKCDECRGAGDMMYAKSGYKCDNTHGGCENFTDTPERIPVQFPDSMILFQSDLISKGIDLKVENRAFRPEDELEVEREQQMELPFQHPKLPEARRSLMKLLYNLERPTNSRMGNLGYFNYNMPVARGYNSRIKRPVVASDDVNSSHLDQLYDKMSTKLDLLDHNCIEFHLIQSYVTNTHAYIQSGFSLIVEDVFKVERQGEKERFQKFKSLHNRQLLWHGSSTTNFASILENGLKIAPTGVQITGAMFGRGIYFADMVTKSANYCRVASHRNTTGLMVLSEVALGNTLDLEYAQNIQKLGPNQHSVKGVGMTYPDPEMAHTTEDGMIIPLGLPIKDTNNAQVNRLGYNRLNYNEYIVYDPSQVNIKYLVKLKFQLPIKK